MRERSQIIRNIARKNSPSKYVRDFDGHQVRSSERITRQNLLGPPSIPPGIDQS
jgi:hypothetical protein